MKKLLQNLQELVFHSGGDEGDRTPGLSIANAALSQLSYIPTGIIGEPTGACLPPSSMYVKNVFGPPVFFRRNPQASLCAYLI